MGVPLTLLAHAIMGQEESTQQTAHTQGDHSVPTAHSTEFSANISSNSHQTKERESEAVVHGCFTNAYEFQIKIEDIL